MRLERMLSINVAALAVMGTLMVGISKDDPSALLPVIVLLCATASVWFTDITGRFQVGHSVANSLVFIAVIVAAMQLFRITGRSGALVMADLLALVQIILLFQKKDFRVWSNLIVLSFAQTAISATSRQGVSFALLLLVYLFTGLSALALLFLFRERVYYHQIGHVTAAQDEADGPRLEMRVDWRRLIKVGLATLVVGPMSLFLHFRDPARPDRIHENSFPSSSGGRWPLSGLRPRLSGTSPGLAGRAGVGWELWGRLVRILLATLLLAAIFFACVPHLGSSGRFLGLKWIRSGGRTPTTAVGFNDKVQLGDIGQVIENLEEVLRIRFTVDDRPYAVAGSVYLRGAALAEYKNDDFDETGWETVLRPTAGGRSRGQPSGGDAVHQYVVIEPMNRRELFCVWPFFSESSDASADFDPRDEKIRRALASQRRQMKYDLWTTAFVDGRQTRLTAVGRWVDVEQLLELPRRDLPELIARADRWLQQSRLPDDDAHGRALYLSARFHDLSQGFQYTLERDPTVVGTDPAEDFIKNQPQGHCEYFATALALMLRSQNIPSRVIVGYRTEEYYPNGHYFQVRQSYAHAWVEAYLGPSQLPEELTTANPTADWTRGGWLRLDPTPGNSADESLAHTIRSWGEWIQYAWKTYVLDMGPNRQRETIYDPLRRAIRTLGQNLVDPQWWRDLGPRIKTAWRSLRDGLAGGRWFSWRGGLAAMVASTIFYLAYRGFRLFVWPLLWWIVRRSQDSSHRRQRVQVEFYRRLEALLARRGITRKPTRTQREFALEAGRRLVEQAEQTDDESLAAAPPEVAEAFYDVRFGGVPLDKRRLQAVERALSRIEAAGQ